MKPLTLRLGPILFRPRLVSSLCTVILFPTLVYLGHWQFNRYEYKLNLEKQISINSLMPAIAHLPIDIENPDTFKSLRYRSLEISGYFLNEHTLLLDNQLVQGKVGYRVLTPFRWEGHTKWVLVDRGFIATGNDRQIAPYVWPVFEKMTLIGILNQPVHALTLPAIFSQKSDPSKCDPIHHAAIDRPSTRIQKVDFSKLSMCLKNEFYPFIFQLKPNHPYGFHISLTPPVLNPERHLGYAFQWFTMALVSMIYYCLINSRLTQNAKKILST